MAPDPLRIHPLVRLNGSDKRLRRAVSRPSCVNKAVGDTKTVEGVTPRFLLSYYFLKQHPYTLVTKLCYLITL